MNSAGMYNDCVQTVAQAILPTADGKWYIAIPSISAFLPDEWYCTFEDAMEAVVSLYYLPVWAKLLGSKTPESDYGFTVADFMDKSKHAAIQERMLALDQRGVFCRLEHASPKLLQRHTSPDTVIRYLLSSSRTSAFTPDTRVVMRRYIEEIGDMGEFRCFVADGRVRGITGPEAWRKHYTWMKAALVKFATGVAQDAEYSDCTVDVAMDIRGKLIAIEINSPVWANATSGGFDLSNPRDVHILCGEEIDYFPYPEFRSFVQL